MLHHLFDGWAPGTESSGPTATARWWRTGSGMTTTYALAHEPPRARDTAARTGTRQVYEGMVIGENARAEEMDVKPEPRTEADQRRGLRSGRGLGKADPADVAFARAGSGVHRRGRVRRGDTHRRSGSARSSCDRRDQGGRARAEKSREGDRSVPPALWRCPLRTLPARREGEAVGEASARSLRTTSATAGSARPRWTGSCRSAWNRRGPGCGHGGIDQDLRWAEPSRWLP